MFILFCWMESIAYATRENAMSDVNKLIDEPTVRRALGTKVYCMTQIASSKRNSA